MAGYLEKLPVNQKKVNWSSSTFLGKVSSISALNILPNILFHSRQHCSKVGESDTSKFCMGNCFTSRYVDIATYIPGLFYIHSCIRLAACRLMPLVLFLFSMV